MGGWGVAPLARSTPTLPTRAQRDVGKDTPKKSILFLNFAQQSQNRFLKLFYFILCIFA
ncbi:MAG: hypothetical protein NZ455_11670 [Bacteroidia bacterium]|nr:hypothetical protein [Bacteroidia bacterium]